MATNTSILGLTKPTYAEDQDITVLNGNSDLIDAEAGRTRANFAGTYSATDTYAVGDYCIYTGNLYRCTTAIGSGGEAWNASHWSQVSVGSELVSQNAAIANLNISAISSSTTIASLCNSCPAGQHRYYFIADSNTLTDYPSTARMYRVLLSIHKIDGSNNRADIEIIGKPSSNEPQRFIGVYENGTLYWSQLATTGIIKFKNITVTSDANSTIDLSLTGSIAVICVMGSTTLSNVLAMPYRTNNEWRARLVNATTGAALSQGQRAFTVVYTEL